MSTTPEEARDIAQEAAREAVANLFLHLGYDVEDKSQVTNLKKDLAHLRGWREATETVRKQSSAAMWTVLVSGGIAIIVLGVQAFLNK